MSPVQLKPTKNITFATMTLRYAYLAPSHKVNAVNVLDSTMNGAKKSTIQSAGKWGN